MAANTPAGDRARVSVGVALPPAQAFRIFTEEIELWWRRGPRFRCAPGDAGTLITVTHSGWAAIRDDHPVRHGKTGADFSREIGLWWGGLLSALRVRCAKD